MTLQTPPSWLQAGSYPAQYDRLTQQALYATTGVIGSSSLAVTANSPVGMSVRVASGWAAVIGTTTSNMGAYTFFNDAQETLTITTADPTNPRIDLVCATVRDAFYAGANNDVIFQVIAGTPAGSPVAPALPANSISLATVAVAAGATQIISGNITNTRVNVTTNLPGANPRIGQVVTTTTTNTTLATGGAGWIDVSGLSVTITPTLSTSKILIVSSFGTVASSGSSSVYFTGYVQLLKASTSLQNVFVGGYYPNGGGVNTAAYTPYSIQYVDSPATTSATTYKMQINNILGAASFSANPGGQSVQISAMEILV